MNSVAPTSTEQIVTELRDMGYAPEIQPDPLVSGRHKIVFEHDVDCGEYSGEKILFGVSMHGNESYPEYPPHWIHIHPPIHDDRPDSIRKYKDANGSEWIAMSRPPAWDSFPAKNMKIYVNLHIRDICNKLQ